MKQPGLILVKNKFRFEWLNCEDEHGDILSSYMQRGLVYFVVLTILNNSSNPKNAQNKVVFGIKRYYIPVLGLSNIFCIFCLGLLASLNNKCGWLDGTQA